MPATITDSNLITAYKEKKRVRTTTYRGSMLTTTTRITNSSFPGDEVGSILYLTLMPFGASLKYIQYLFSANLSATALRLNMGIAGINQDGSFTKIKDDIGLGTIEPIGAANIIHNLSCLNISDKTIYELLCENRDGYQVPIAKFEPYTKTKYGVLYFISTAKNNDALNTDLVMKLQFVEGSPSSSPLTVQDIR